MLSVECLSRIRSLPLGFWPGSRNCLPSNHPEGLLSHQCEQQKPGPIGVYNPEEPNYHSFRHNVTTKLAAEAVSLEIRNELLGREGQSTDSVSI